MPSTFDQTVGVRRALHEAKTPPGSRPASAAGRKTWKQQAQEVGREVEVIWLVCKDRRTPWFARLIAACAVGYVFSPIQLIPSFIPVIGFLDDFVVLAVGFKAARRLAGEEIVRDCRERAAASPVLSRGDIQPLAKPVGAIIAGLWLAATIAATMWLYR